MPFVHNYENYLLKIREDTDFVKLSFLKNYMHFTEEFDPFFLSFQKPIIDSDGPTLIHEIKPSLLQRIRASELILLEEALHKVNNYSMQT